MTNMKSYTASKGLGRAQAQVPWLWHGGLLFSLHQWFSRLIFSRILFPNETLSKPWFTQQIKLETFCLNRGKGVRDGGCRVRAPSHHPDPPSGPCSLSEDLWGLSGLHMETALHQPPPLHARPTHLTMPYGDVCVRRINISMHIMTSLKTWKTG